MKLQSIITGALVLVFFLFAQRKAEAQAITEYGKQMEGLKQPPSVKLKPPKIPSAGKQGVAPTETTGEPELPMAPIPRELSVRRSPAYLYAQQDELGRVVAKLEQGELLIPLAEASSSGETWYMVKTQKSALMGWVRSSDVGKLQ
ncbi:MAG: hypothetical protein ACREQA_04525 [Candidatus Binatia bacterium]